MKKFSILSLALLLTFSLSISVFGVIEFNEEISASGMTWLNGKVTTMTVMEKESLQNFGNLYLEKGLTLLDPQADEFEGTGSRESFGFKDISADGFTRFEECLVVGGVAESADPDAHVALGYINEVVQNEGAVEISKYFNNFAEYKVFESKDVSGVGETTIDKMVAWWTPAEWDYDNDPHTMVLINKGFADGDLDAIYGGEFGNISTSYVDGSEFPCEGWCDSRNLDHADQPFDYDLMNVTANEPIDFHEDVTITWVPNPFEENNDVS